MLCFFEAILGVNLGDNRELVLEVQLSGAVWWISGQAGLLPTLDWRQPGSLSIRVRCCQAVSVRSGEVEAVTPSS